MEVGTPLRWPKPEMVLLVWYRLQLGVILEFIMDVNVLKIKIIEVLL